MVRCYPKTLGESKVEDLKHMSVNVRKVSVILWRNRKQNLRR